jgi:hypothetical protein
LEDLKLLNEQQSELINKLNDALRDVAKAGLIVRGNEKLDGLGIMRQDIIEKLRNNEEIPEVIDYTDEQKNASDTLHETILACGTTDIVFHCDAEGMYAMDKVYYDQFVSDHPTECSAEEWNDFQTHIITLEDEGAYYKVPSDSCDSCSCDCDKCNDDAE